MGLLPAACCMYLHGIYLCIPDGVIFSFLSDREACGPRIMTKTVSKDTDSHVWKRDCAGWEELRAPGDRCATVHLYRPARENICSKMNKTELLFKLVSVFSKKSRRRSTSQSFSPHSRFHLVEDSGLVQQDHVPDTRRVFTVHRRILSLSLSHTLTHRSKHH